MDRQFVHASRDMFPVVGRHTSPEPHPDSGGAEPIKHVPEAKDKTKIVVASTFTADPVERPLSFWMGALSIPAEVEIAPYAQVIQELLNPSSALSQNSTGFNVLLVRIEDWIRDRYSDTNTQENIEHIERTITNLETGMRLFRDRNSAPVLLFLCPDSSSLSAEYRPAFADMRQRLVRKLHDMEHLYWWGHPDLVSLYPVEDYEDLRSDRIGHIPYSDAYFTALGTILGRRITTLAKPRYKVIVLDCDNTLWNGICGEVGAHGVEITPAHVKFHQLLVEQHDSGMLLCLCSKNNPQDVDAVFQNRTEIRLRPEHFISIRVNWQRKSENIKSLADELGLGIDSFVLIDDSSLECAEVAASSPEVLTLQFPQTEPEIEHFLRHQWLFDRLAITDESKRRTAQYKENRERSKALGESGDLDEFIESLELKVEVAPMSTVHLARVVELIQRTNQFNMTTIRRNAGELETLLRTGEDQCRVTHVSDRFGDYGLVGVVLYRSGADSIVVDTFVLSCRALGRRVEHRIVNELGRLARLSGKAHVVLNYRRTAKNQPAWEFLREFSDEFRGAARADGDAIAEAVFRLPVKYAEEFTGRNVASPPPKGANQPRQQFRPAQRGAQIKWPEKAYSLSRLADIDAEINRLRPIRLRTDAARMHGDTVEAAVATIWSEILGIGLIGLRDNFFDLGGDSLLAVRAIAHMGARLGLELPLREFFEAPTVEQVTYRLSAAMPADSPIQRTTDHSFESDSSLSNMSAPMSWAQQRLWFIHELHGSHLAYHIPDAFRIEGPLDKVMLQRALDQMIVRHESLRTVFGRFGETFVQNIGPAEPFSLQIVDLRFVPSGQTQDEVLRQARAEIAEPFDLAKGPLARAKLLQLKEHEHVLLVTLHHVVSDGWSMGVFARELGQLYSAFIKGESVPLSPLPIQYVDYSIWQRSQVSEAILRKQLEYWRESLKAAPELLRLPSDRPRPMIPSHRGGAVTIVIESELTGALKRMSRRQNVTLAMSLFAAWFIVLMRLSGETDMVIGMPVANRRRMEVEGLIGFFVNTLALRVTSPPGTSVASLLEQVKNRMLGGYTNQDVPFEKVVEAIQPTRGLNHHPLFQVMFVLQNTPPGSLEIPGLAIERLNTSVNATQFDLTLSLVESSDQLIGTISYLSYMFDESTVTRWAESLHTVLTALSENVASEVDRIPVVNREQLDQVLLGFNNTRADYPREQLVHELFEQRVRVVPDALAITCGERQVTYRWLNQQANRVARGLLENGVKTDDRVAVYAQRGIDFVVSILGILKAGAGFVPLDMTYPTARLQQILKDSAPVVILSQTHLLEKVPESSAPVLVLDDEASGLEECTDLIDSELGVRPENLAYVIYTSGSTGVPKGVAIEHRNVTNMVRWHMDRFGHQLGWRCSAVAALGFDAAYFEILPTLISGATLVISEPAVTADPDTLMSWWKAEPLDLSFLPTPLAEVALSLNATPPGLKTLMVGGDRLRRTNRTGRYELVNNYGPTEATVLATSGLIRAEDSVIHIGRPIANTRIYILDPYEQPVPIGVTGEIYIGGAGVARGYLGRPDLTRERFVRDPFNPEGYSTMYKTGDLGRWRTDGTIEYLGRNDSQVKLRGFRIELGEIETQLRGREDIKEALVLTRQDEFGQTHLVAYIVPRRNHLESVDEYVAELRQSLGRLLPEYMVPNAIVLLGSLPLTPNGKIDLSSLPAPELRRDPTKPFEPPVGEVEEVVAGIWKEQLGVDRVGRSDTFFELGGHSLLGMQMMVGVRAALGIEVPMRILFEVPSLSEFSAKVHEIRQSNLDDLVLRGGRTLEELLDRVESMPESEVRELVEKLRMERR